MCKNRVYIRTYVLYYIILSNICTKVAKSVEICQKVFEKLGHFVLIKMVKFNWGCNFIINRHMLELYICPKYNRANIVSKLFQM